MLRKNLKEWRNKNGFNQNFVAEKLGITKMYFIQIERGNKNPSYDLLKRFEKVFIVDNVWGLFELIE